MVRRLRIGLTGGIASGKSIVAARFGELGVSVIDADEVARAIVAPGQPALTQVVEKFGLGVLTAGGELDRRALRNLVFADPALRKDLETMLHPLIREEMERRAALVRTPYVVLAIPLLVESGNLERFDRILVVDLDENTQLQRLMARDFATLDQARSMLAAQASRHLRLKAADDVLVNGGTVVELRLAVDAIHERYLRLASAGL